MRPLRMVVLLALTGCSPATIDPTAPAPSDPALVRLSDVHAGVVSQVCGRRPYEEPYGFAPTDATLSALARDTDLLAEHPAAPDAFAPRDYVRQVVGLKLADGRERLYVNAFLPDSPCALTPSVPCTACTADAWGALYDPYTRTFEELSFSAAG